jgi:holo-[acyl-carrier protein] synthase
MIGIDLIKIDRVEKMIDRFGNKALSRFLNEDEMQLIKKPSRAAGFWAAKEAASKALQTGIGSECSFHDIILSLSPKGAPLIHFSDKIIDNFNIKNASLSITHDAGFAIAVVAIES